MATLKQIRRRIRSIQSTQQITKAMEMVAAAKLKRSQDRALAARPYAERIHGILSRLAGAARDFSHPLFEVREVNRRVLVVIASDKGLCGSFNMNVLRVTDGILAEAALVGGRDRMALVPVGKKATVYYTKRGWPCEYRIPELGDQTDPVKAASLAKELIRLYTDGEVDEVELIYTRFITTVSRTVRRQRLLPITAEGPEAGGNADIIFEPSPEGIFHTLLPRYVENRILQAFSESLASEHGARMVSMGAATKNAKEVIEHLTLVRNRLRQAAITREISEIVGGAGALE